MSMTGGGAYRRYSMLRGAGTAMFVFCILFAVGTAIVIIMAMAMVSSSYGYGPPDWFYLVLVLMMLFLVGYLLVFGFAFKLLSAALAESGERMERVRSALHGHATGTW